MPLEFDYVSDLHIDHWDKDYYFATDDTREGVKKNIPFIFQRPTTFDDGQKKILIVAGDVSDDIEVTLSYLSKLRRHYDHIIYTDGNHEHYHAYPRLLDTSSFPSYKGLRYLRNEDVIIEDTAFIGACGWWDYSGGRNIEKYKTSPFNEELAYSVIDRAIDDFGYIIEKVEEYGKRDDINEIVIVTHTVPKYIFAREPDTDLNSKFDIKPVREWIKLSRGKLKRWIFGHNHQKFNMKKSGIQFLSNPRGRPEDYDREDYNVERSRM